MMVTMAMMMFIKMAMAMPMVVALVLLVVVIGVVLVVMMTPPAAAAMMAAGALLVVDAEEAERGVDGGVKRAARDEAMRAERGVAADSCESDAGLGVSLQQSLICWAGKGGLSPMFASPA
jgi:hypothetical protein